MSRVRAAGYQPVTRPLQRGLLYVLRALDRNEFETRIIVDARSGRLLTATRLVPPVEEGPGNGGYRMTAPTTGSAPPPIRPPRGVAGTEEMPAISSGVLPQGPGRNAGSPSLGEPAAAPRNRMTAQSTAAAASHPPLPRSRPAGIDAANRGGAAPPPDTAPAAAELPTAGSDAAGPLPPPGIGSGP